MINYDVIGMTIREIVQQINLMFGFLIDKLTDTRFFTVFIQSSESTNLVKGIQSTALVLCTMFFMIDFFTKSLHLQWVTWENVLLLFMKLFVAKLCVENAVWITSCLYSGFTDVVKSIDPVMQYQLIPITDTDSGVSWLDAYKYFVSSDLAQKIVNKDASGYLDFGPLLINVQVQIQGMVLKVVMVIADVVVLGRLFELVVYTLIAPIPLSTLACDGLTDIGKGFLKSYAAVCVQALVLVIMFVAYSKVSSLLFSIYSTGTTLSLDGWLGMLTTLTLGLGVMQSGQWAKRICSAM